MFNIVLYEPEIPPNTGNIIRLCSNTGCALHLIEPLGFELTDKHLKRAGLDYELSSPLARYPNFDSYLKAVKKAKIDAVETGTAKTETAQIGTVYLCSTKAETNYASVSFQPGDSFVFGPETRGLPSELLMNFPSTQKIRIPLQPNSRSLNLSNAVAIIVYEAWRQQHFLIH